MSVTKKIFIIGASGHARVLVDLIEAGNQFQIAGLIDIKGNLDTFEGYPVLQQAEVPQQEFNAGIIAVGDNWTRGNVAAEILKNSPGFTFVTAIHPTACVSPKVVVGAGSVVMAGAVINPGSRIGDHCIINTSTSVDHDCELGDFSSIAPGAVLGGNVKVGKFSAISLGAKVIHGITVGDHTVVGAGATVLEPIGDQVVAFGSPSRVIRSRLIGERYL